MKRTALIAGIIALVMLGPICYFFPEQAGKIGAIGVAFIVVCIFFFKVFNKFDE